MALLHYKKKILVFETIVVKLHHAVRSLQLPVALCLMGQARFRELDDQLTMAIMNVMCFVNLVYVEN